MPSLTIYTTPTCPWCHKAKEFLKMKKIRFMEKNVAEDEAARDELMKKSGQMGVPVLDIGGEIIVGFDQEAITAALKKTTTKNKTKNSNKKIIKKTKRKR